MQKCVFCGEEIQTDSMGEIRPRNYVKSNQDGRGHYWWCPAVLCRDLDDGGQRLECGSSVFYDGKGEKPTPALCCDRSVCQKKRKTILKGCAADKVFRGSLAHNREEYDKSARKIRPILKEAKLSK